MTKLTAPGVSGSLEPSAPTPAPPPSTSPAGTAKRPWWQRRVVLIVGLMAGFAGVVGLVAGAVMLQMASSTQTDADATAAEVDRLSAEFDALEAENDAASAEIGRVEAAAVDLAAERASAQQQLDQLVSTTSDVVEATDLLYVAVVDTFLAHDEVRAVFNEAIDAENAGDRTGAEGIMAQRGAEKIGAFQAGVEAERNALADLQLAVNALHEEVGDDG